MLFIMLLAMSWEKTLSAPAHPPRPSASSKALDYPDSFALRTEYMEGISIERYTIQNEDTLSQVCQRFGIPISNLAEWRQFCSDYKEICLLRPGEEFVFHLRRESQDPFKLVYFPANGPKIVLRKKDDQWECWKAENRVLSMVTTVSGSISDNLYDSAVQAGLPPKLILELADLFAYDVDFNTDLQKDDSFAVHFEQQVSDGKRLQSGPILAAEMEVGGRLYQAFAYQFEGGGMDYFDAKGNSLRKFFLKAPLSYSRISSTFTNSRYHPILKISRPHHGIDYAAPAGTPISALGSGTVTFIGTKGGFGKYIELKHDSTYKTAYGHLSRFAPKLKAGSKVQQGQVIGYVGSTGLATGPHLDFRFFKNGKPIDFLKTDFPHARSIPKALRADFKAKCKLYLAKLHAGHFAGNENSSSNAR